MKKFGIISLIIAALFFQYCSSSKKSSSAAKPVLLNYVTNVQPTIVANCSPCHIPPRGNKKALDTYDAAKSNVDDIIARIKLAPGQRGFMPFKHDKLSDSVINIFVQWKSDGLLEK